MLFSKKNPTPTFNVDSARGRAGSVIGQGINWHGDLNGSGTVRVEGTLNGEITLRGTLVVGETGKVSCRELKAETLIVAGYVQGNVTCQKLEIRATGRVWGDVVTTSFSSEDGAFLRGQMRMEEKVEIPAAEESPVEEPTQSGALPETADEPQPTQEQSHTPPDEKTPPAEEKPKLKAPWDI